MVKRCLPVTPELGGGGQFGFRSSISNKKMFLPRPLKKKQYCGKPQWRREVACSASERSPNTQKALLAQFSLWAQQRREAVRPSSSCSCNKLNNLFTILNYPKYMTIPDQDIINWRKHPFSQQTAYWIFFFFLQECGRSYEQSAINLLLRKPRIIGKDEVVICQTAAQFFIRSPACVLREVKRR